MIWNNNTITTQRFVTVNGKSTYSNNLTGVECYIEPYQGSYQYQDENLLGYKLFQLITEEQIDLLRGDRVIDAQANQYTVYELLPYSNNDDVPNHTEAILTMPA